MDAHQPPGPPAVLVHVRRGLQWGGRRQRAHRDVHRHRAGRPNISESHAGVTYAQLLPNDDYYWSTTLTTLIVATYGGGTGLPTRRECLELTDCYAKGKLQKFAETCAGVVLAGDISLTCAILAGDWVSSHEQYGRNR